VKERTLPRSSKVAVLVGVEALGLVGVGDLDEIGIEVVEPAMKDPLHAGLVVGERVRRAGLEAQARGIGVIAPGLEATPAGIVTEMKGQAARASM
jgi:hypothetical protein